MRILFLGTDRKLFENGSAVRARFTRFSQAYPADRFDSIIFSLRSHGIADADTISPGMHAYPTRSWSRLMYGVDAIAIAWKLPRPDIITAQDPFETGLVAWCISRLRGVPFAVEIHTDFLTPSYARHSLLNRLRVALAGFVIARAAGGYAVSARLAESLTQRYHPPYQLSVLPIYIDLANFTKLSRTPHEGALLWVGRLAPEKRPDVALDALAYARSKGHAVHLTVLGDGPLQPYLRGLAASLGIADHVTFLGWQDPTRYLPLSELMLVTSEYEGYGMAIIEALAAGVPVLSPDVGVAREAGACIAHGQYADALVAWLTGPRLPGTLTLKSYVDEQEYFSLTRAFYASLAT